MARAPVSLCQRNSSPHCLLQSRRSSGGRQRHQVSAEALQDDGDTASLLTHADDNRRAVLLNLNVLYCRKLSTCSAAAAAACCAGNDGRFSALLAPAAGLPRLRFGVAGCCAVRSAAAPAPRPCAGHPRPLPRCRGIRARQGTRKLLLSVATVREAEKRRMAVVSSVDEKQAGSTGRR